MVTGDLENNFKKVTYEILYQGTNDEKHITTYGYDSIEDFGLYTSDIEKVTGVKKIEHIETEIKIENL